LTLALLKCRGYAAGAVFLALSMQNARYINLKIIPEQRSGVHSRLSLRAMVETPGSARIAFSIKYFGEKSISQAVF